MDHWIFLNFNVIILVVRICIFKFKCWPATNWKFVLIAISQKSTTLVSRSRAHNFIKKLPDDGLKSLYIRSHVKPILGQKVFKKMFQKCILLATKVFFSGNPPKINNPSFFSRNSRWVEVSNFEYKMYIYFFAQNYLKVCKWNKKSNMKLIQTSAVSDM